MLVTWCVHSQSVIQHVDGGPKRPGSLNFLILILDALHKRYLGVSCNLEALGDEAVAEGKVQAHEGRLLLIHLQIMQLGFRL